jgi:hypothetical protein
MMDTIDFNISRFSIEFRVWGLFALATDEKNEKVRVVFTSSFYQDCEQFIWNYGGEAFELRIDKYWVRKP